LMHSLLYDFYSSDQRFARRLVCSPHPASFRFAVTCNTLAFGYILPATGRIRDLHPLETCAARRTTTAKSPGVPAPGLFYSLFWSGRAYVHNFIRYIPSNLYLPPLLLFFPL